jgi:hypothetical protein
MVLIQFARQTSISRTTPLLLAMDSGVNDHRLSTTRSSKNTYGLKEQRKDGGQERVGRGMKALAAFFRRFVLVRRQCLPYRHGRIIDMRHAPNARVIIMERIRRNRMVCKEPKKQVKPILHSYCMLYQFPKERDLASSFRYQPFGAREWKRPNSQKLNCSAS